MPYESSKDVETFSKALESDNNKIVVSVHSYNNGPKKLQIVREIKNNEGNFIFSKLGRLTKEELEGIIPFMQEAIKTM